MIYLLILGIVLFGILITFYIKKRKCPIICIGFLTVGLVLISAYLGSFFAQKFITNKAAKVEMDKNVIKKILT